MTANFTSLDEMSGKLTYALRLKKLVNAIHSAPDFDTVLIGLQNEIIKLYESQMVTIYLVDSEKKELYSLALLSANQLKEIRIPINSNSIAIDSRRKIRSSRLSSQGMFGSAMVTFFAISYPAPSDLPQRKYWCTAHPHRSALFFSTGHKEFAGLP